MKEEIIRKALTFGYGGMTEPELGYLYDNCKSEDVLELGSHIGQSAYVIASVAKELTCVDAWQDGCPYLDDRQSSIYSQQGPGMEEQFDKNTKEYTNITKIKGFTSTAGPLKDHYRIIVIDADHSYEGVKADINRFKYMADYIFFHDYNSSWEGVKQAVDEEGFDEVGRVGYLLLVRGKKHE